MSKKWKNLEGKFYATVKNFYSFNFYSIFTAHSFCTFLHILSFCEIWFVISFSARMHIEYVQTEIYFVCIFCKTSNHLSKKRQTLTFWKTEYLNHLDLFLIDGGKALDILICQITTFIKVCVAFVFWALETLIDRFYIKSLNLRV